MKNIHYILILSLILSCKKNSNEHSSNLSIENTQNISIANKDISKALDSFIINTNIYSVEKRKDILIYFYQDKKDTILSFKNRSPYECKNIAGVGNYKKYNLFFYSPKALKSKLCSLIAFEEKNYVDKCNNSIDTSFVDEIYQKSFFLKKDRLHKFPILLSTPVE